MKLGAALNLIYDILEHKIVADAAERAKIAGHVSGGSTTPDHRRRRAASISGITEEEPTQELGNYIKGFLIQKFGLPSLVRADREGEPWQTQADTRFCVNVHRSGTPTFTSLWSASTAARTRVPACGCSVA